MSNNKSLLRIISVQPQSIITTILMLPKDIVLEKMYLSRTLLMNSFIINYVLLLIEEPLNFYNSCVKIITSKVKILSVSNQESKDKLTLLTSQLDNLEVFSK